MSLRHLRVDGVRCLREVELELDAQRNYLWGPNGAGKTSCLEAIYLLGRGRSFRTRQNARLIQHGRSDFSVFGIVADAGPHEHRIGLECGTGGLQIQLDGRKPHGQAELVRLLPVHVIDPRLHQLVESGPSERRRYIDAGVFHVEHRFLTDWRHYRQVLGQRNAALKAGVGDSELAVWTRPLVEAGSSVHRARSGYVEALAQIASHEARTLVGHDVQLTYRPGWRRGLSLAEALAESRDRDRASGFTQVGPHRADLKLDFDRGGIRETASRGQQKLVAAALVVAQVRLFEQRTGQRSVVLVDDASAELDDGAQERLLTSLDGLASQQVLTGLSLAALRPRAGFPVFHVEQGRVRSMV